MKVVVLGASGMLGHLTSLYLEELGYTIYRVGRSSKQHPDITLIDVMENNQIEFYLDSIRPDVIVNCIALLVRESECCRARAVYINSYFPQWLSEKYRQTKVKIIQVSTDGIFDGKARMYNEHMFCTAPSFYGQTKYMGEINNTKDLTIRSAFFGPDTDKNKDGLLNWFLQAQGEISGYDKVLFNGVTSLEFAKFVHTVIQHDISGIYHLTAKESISKGQLLRLVQQVFRKNDVYIVSDNSRVSNHTLKNTRILYTHDESTYQDMIEELREWIERHKQCYMHYEISDRH